MMVEIQEMGFRVISAPPPLSLLSTTLPLPLPTPFPPLPTPTSTRPFSCPSSYTYLCHHPKPYPLSCPTYPCSCP